MELILQEGKIHDTMYYTVHPQVPEMYHQAQQTWNDMLEWCVNTYGPGPEDGIWTPNSRWYANNSKFWFMNQEDLEWFVLRWS